jgi:uncharacterized protein (DUF305 family)
VETRTKRSELRTLADRIAAGQGRESSLMQGWLQAWGKPAAPQGMTMAACTRPAC